MPACRQQPPFTPARPSRPRTSPPPIRPAAPVPPAALARATPGTRESLASSPVDGWRQARRADFGSEDTPKPRRAKPSSSTPASRSTESGIPESSPLPPNPARDRCRRVPHAAASRRARPRVATAPPTPGPRGTRLGAPAAEARARRAARSIPRPRIQHASCRHASDGVARNPGGRRRVRSTAARRSAGGSRTSRAVRVEHCPSIETVQSCRRGSRLCFGAPSRSSKRCENCAVPVLQRVMGAVNAGNLPLAEEGSPR